MTTLANPHDAFCKYVLGRPKLAGAFLEHFLPAALVAPLDLATLAPLPGSFVDPNLANHHSDLLFRVSGKDGAPILVYVLFEHKSEPDRRTPLQLLRYMERIWDAHLKDGGRLPLPAILPIVIHQGPPAWPWPPRFGEIVDCSPGHARFVPAFEYQLVDLCRFNDEEMPAEPFLAGALLAMKHVRHPDLAQVIESPGLRIRAIIELPDGVDLFQTMLRYICSVISAKRRQEVWTAIERAMPQEGEKYMQTIAESWIEEGFFKGMNEGMGLGCSEGMHVLYETIVEILELRFSTVPQRLKKRLKTIDDLSSLKNLRKKFRIAASIQACERIASEEMSHRAMPLPSFDPAAYCQEIWSAFESALPQEGTALMQAVAKEFFEEGYIKGKYEATSMAIAELAGATAEILELRFGPVPRTLALRLNTVRTFDELSALRSQLREATSIADCERIIGQQA